MSSEPEDQTIDIAPPGEAELEVADAAQEIEAQTNNLPAQREDAPPQVLVTFPLRRSVPFPSLIMPVRLSG